MRTSAATSPRDDGSEALTSAQVFEGDRALPPILFDSMPGLRVACPLTLICLLMWEFWRAFACAVQGDMGSGGARRHFFPLTSLQIGCVSFLRGLGVYWVGNARGACDLAVEISCSAFAGSVQMNISVEWRLI